MSPPNGHAKDPDAAEAANYSTETHAVPVPPEFSGNQRFSPQEIKDFCAALEIPFDPGDRLASNEYHRERQAARPRDPLRRPERLYGSLERAVYTGSLDRSLIVPPCSSGKLILSPEESEDLFLNRTVIISALSHVSNIGSDGNISVAPWGLDVAKLSGVPPLKQRPACWAGN
jgi:hypothetical protein